MPVSRSTGEETNFVPGQAVFELTMHQCIEAGQAFDFGYGDPRRDSLAAARCCATVSHARPGFCLTPRTSAAAR